MRGELADRAWTERWPAWSGRWYGVTLRVLLAALGLLTGLGLTWLAFFGATFKKDQPEWDGEAVSFLVLGAFTVIVAIAVSAKPSRLTVLLAVLLALAIPLVGSIV